MNPAELLAVLRTQIAEVKEIPPPQAQGAPAPHEAKPYRDPYLFVSCPAEQWAACAKLLKENEKLSFDFLTMLTAVDYAKPTATELPRIDVVYHFYSFKHRSRMVVKVSTPRDNGSVPSVIALWPAADWQEREVYDMYGVRFDGHPNLSRILMWDGFPGWPLRKDYVHVPDAYDD